MRRHQTVSVLETEALQVRQQRTQELPGETEAKLARLVETPCPWDQTEI
jgi:hypothetical protein